MAKRAKSDILAAVHETATGMHKSGAFNQTTMREFDALCLTPVTPLEPEQIKKIREHTHTSQAVFATFLNTTVSTVQKWETGSKHPNGTALKLLHLVQRKGLESIA